MTRFGGSTGRLSFVRMTGRSLRGRTAATLVAAVAALALSSSALASGTGLIDQYVEDIPSAGGSQHAGGAGGPTGGSGSGGSGSISGGAAIVLPAAVAHAKGKDAQKLRDVASSPRYGAPRSTVPIPEASSADAGLTNAVSAVAGGGDGRMIGLFIALLAVTAVSLGLAAARRRA
jgi:hypothetical protein